MPRSLVVAVVAAIIGISALQATNAAANSTPATPGLALGDALTVAPTPSTPDTWAVTVGINTYDTSNNLEVAVADSITVDQRLGALGIPADHRIRLLDSNATNTALRDALAWLTSHASADDTAILTIAAHAVTTPTGQHAIRTTDGELITDTELAELLAPLEATTWIIMATCHGGGFDELLTPNRTLTAAAPADQLAYENPDLGHSYLIEYLFNRQLANTTPDAPIDLQAAFAATVTDLNGDFPDRLPIQSGAESELRLTP